VKLVIVISNSKGVGYKKGSNQESISDLVLPEIKISEKTIQV
jgi:hypothetical protein